jgi:hypothetical protein
VLELICKIESWRSNHKESNFQNSNCGICAGDNSFGLRGKLFNSYDLGKISKKYMVGYGPVEEREAFHKIPPCFGTIAIAYFAVDGELPDCLKVEILACLQAFPLSRGALGTGASCLVVAEAVARAPL